jgi:type I restriction enzyme S subunit
MSQEQIQIPKGWEISTLEEMAKQEKGSIRRGPWGGSILKSDFVQSGYKVYQQKNVIYNDFEFGDYFINKEKYNE